MQTNPGSACPGPLQCGTVVDTLVMTTWLVATASFRGIGKVTPVTVSSGEVMMCAPIEYSPLSVFPDGNVERAESPAGPSAPLGPSAPFAPAGPRAPVAPVVPGAPCGPMAPLPLSFLSTLGWICFVELIR